MLKGGYQIRSACGEGENGAIYNISTYFNYETTNTQK